MDMVTRDRPKIDRRAAVGDSFCGYWMRKHSSAYVPRPCA